MMELSHGDLEADAKDYAIDVLIEKLLRVEGNRPDSIGVCTQWHRNPEGPEAVSLIEATRAELSTAHALIHQLGENAAKAAGEYAERVAVLEGHIRTLIQLSIDGGLTHDLVAQLYPDSKKPNGQPAFEFAKRAQRTINEARAALTEPTDG